MEKLTTLNKKFDIDNYQSKISIYNNIMGMLSNKINVRFYDIDKEIFLWEDFDAKMAGRISDMFMINNKLILIGNGKCKIFDMGDKLKLSGKIDLKDIDSCFLSNDGNKMMVCNENTMLLVDLITCEIIKKSSFKGDVMLVDDKIIYYNDNVSRKVFKIFDMNNNPIYSFSYNMTDVNFNYKSRYSFIRGVGKLVIIDKITGNSFSTINELDSENDAYMSIIDDKLYIVAFLKVFVYKILFDEQKISLIGEINTPTISTLICDCDKYIVCSTGNKTDIYLI